MYKLNDHDMSSITTMPSLIQNVTEQGGALSQPINWDNVHTPYITNIQYTFKWLTKNMVTMVQYGQNSQQKWIIGGSNSFSYCQTCILHYHNQNIPNYILIQIENFIKFKKL